MPDASKDYRSVSGRVAWVVSWESFHAFQCFFIQVLIRVKRRTEAVHTSVLVMEQNTIARVALALSWKAIVITAQVKITIRLKPKPKLSHWPIIKDKDNPVNQSKLEAITCSWREARENVRVRVTIGFGFTSDWLRKWREFLTNHKA